MVFTNVYNPRSGIRRMDELRPTLVKKGASIGANATVLCGITIGSYSFIGAGAVVLKDVPDYALVVGNPAKQKGWMCECGIRLVFHGTAATCGECKRRYLSIETNRIEEQV
jgi:UDP-2-acetamido-3-amino-2,3-dideoxy-glucuronate N-acetyltransferase